MSILVGTAIGPATSVQDGGRYGAQRYGLTPSGAMDPLALAVANCLVANPPGAAAIEVGPLATTFTARDGAVRVALAGAPRNAEVAGRPVGLQQSLLLQDGASLTLGFTKDAVFTYIAVAGAIQGEPMYGSLSVNARAGLGSPYPRPLQTGDTLTVASAQPGPEHRIDLPQGADGPIRVVMGPQDDEFDDDAKRSFLDGAWKISAISDRMGYRLEGPVIHDMHGHNIVSDGTVLGSIQVPGNGQPIVLMADRGTSGGYPKIATVISADVGRLAQTPAGKEFHFKAVSMAEAQAEARAFAQLLRSLPGRLQVARGGDFDIDALRNANVAGTAINAIDAGTWQIPPLP